MNGEAGVVLRRILAEDKCDVLVRGEDGEEDGFCKTCNCWVDLSRFYDIDGYYQPCKDCYVCDDDDEDEDECFGKHCCNTENLKLGKCWSRIKQATTEELICEECWEQETKQKCVACCETYTHDQLKLMPEQYPWGSCSDGAYYNFFCVDCIKDINAKR